MGIPTLPGVPMKPTTEQLAQIVAEGFEQLGYLMSGFLSSDNVREIGGWQIGKTEMQSKDKTVGMSTNKVGVDPTRFFAGDVIDGLPKFKVTEAGILTAVGALFLSALGYPRVEINSEDNLIAAYADADTYVAFIPSGVSSVPALVCVDAGTTKTFLNRTAAGGTTLGTFDNEPLNLQASGPLQIGGVNGFDGSVQYVKNVSGGVPIFGNMNFKKGILTSFT